MLKINAPINSFRDLRKIASLGIDSVYVGAYFKNSSLNFSVNRQDGCHISDVKELQNIVNFAHAQNIKVKVTLNNSYKTDEEDLIVKDLIHLLNELNVDNIIVSDLGILEIISENALKIKVTASVLSLVLNSGCVNFFQKYGIDEMVLPYHLDIDEIRQIIEKNKSIKFEIIGLNYGCVFEDGACGLIHDRNIYNKSILNSIIQPFKLDILNLIHKMPNNLKYFIFKHVIKVPPCSITAKDIHIQKNDPKNTKTISYFENKILKNTDSKIFLEKCGICSLFFLARSGLHAVKIAGRDLPIELKIKNIQFMKEAVSLIYNINTFDEYKVEAHKLFQKYKKFKCEGKFCCHTS